MAIPALLMLSYDVDTEIYDSSEIRDEVIKLILQKNKNSKPYSYVSTTIFFQTKRKPPVKKWKKIILEKFPEGFYYSLYRVYESNDKYVGTDKGKKGFYKNFQDDVKRIMKELHPE